MRNRTTTHHIPLSFTSPLPAKVIRILLLIWQLIVSSAQINMKLIATLWKIWFRYSETIWDVGWYALTWKSTARGRAAPKPVPLTVTCTADGALPKEAEGHPSVWVGVTCVSYFFSKRKDFQRVSCVSSMKDMWRIWAQDFWKEGKSSKFH